MWGNYCGLVPITILIGAAVGAGGFGPLSNLLPNLSQSPGHCCLPASKCTETNAATSASQAAITLVGELSLQTTGIPTAAPTPDQFQVSTSHFAAMRMPAMTLASPSGF